MNFADALEAEIKRHVEANLRKPEQRQQVVGAVMDAFGRLRKMPVPDLDKRVKEMQTRIERMVEDMSVQYERGELVVKATGSAEALLVQLRRGSDWYEPEPDIDKLIVAASLTAPKRR